MKKTGESFFGVLAAGLLTLLLPGSRMYSSFPTNPSSGWSNPLQAVEWTLAHIVSGAMSKNHASLDLKLA